MDSTMVGGSPACLYVTMLRCSLAQYVIVMRVAADTSWVLLWATRNILDFGDVCEFLRIFANLSQFAKVCFQSTVIPALCMACGDRKLHSSTCLLSAILCMSAPSG
jgi:hypothetical protein